jgi:protein TonB
MNFKLKPVAIQGEEIIISAKEAKKLNLELAEPEKPAMPAEPVNPNNAVKFIAYDMPPTPIGGQATIVGNTLYPKKAKEAGVEGQVVIQAFINKNGIVENCKVLKGIPNTGLDEAAVAAIKKTKFNPAKQRDKNIGVWISIPVTFKLDKKK